MHLQSRRLMTNFAQGVQVLFAPDVRVLDVGSRDVNGTFREYFPTQRYLGIDIEAGPNVDVVVEEYSYPFADGSFPVIVSGSCLEHVRKPWLWMREVSRLLAPGGRLCVIAPFMHPYHEHPVDCWRIYPDGMRALMEDSGLTVLEATAHDDTAGVDGGFHPILQERIIYHNSEGFCDTLGIATK